MSLETMAALHRHEDLAREDLESLALMKPSSWDLPLALAQGAAIAGVVHAVGTAGMFVSIACGVAFAAFHLAHASHVHSRRLYRQVSALHAMQRAMERRVRSKED